MQKVWDKMTNEELCLEYQQTKQDALYEYFQQRNKPLAMKFCVKYINAIPQYQTDFESCADVAIWRAMNNYTDTFNTKFSTILYYYVRWECQDVIRARHSMRLPVHVWEKLNLMKEKHPDRIYDVLSLDRDYTHDRHESGLDESSLLELIADTSPGPEEIVTESQTNEILKKLITEILRPQQAKAMRLYFGLEDGEIHTLQQIGDMYGVSRERIRQLIVQGLTKLRKRSELFDARKS